MKSSKNLDNLRKRIDSIDEKILDLINKRGKILISLGYKTALPFHGDLALVEFEDNSWGYINKEGLVVWKSAVFQELP